MKKHSNNIDKLFAKKLHDFEVEPSANTWDKLQKQTAAKQKNKVAALWWQRSAWLAAASVVLVAGSIWFSQKSDQTGGVGQVATSAATEKKTSKIVPDLLENKNSVALNKPNEEVIDNESIANINKNRSEVNVETKTKSSIKNNQINTQLLPTQEKVLMASVQKPEEPKKQDNVQQLPTPTPENTIAYNPQPTTHDSKPIATEREKTVEMVLPEIADKEPVQVVFVPEEIRQNAIEEVKQNALNSKKNTKFNRLVKQLKNLKEGEKVDWQEVGFDPNPILAKVGKKI